MTKISNFVSEFLKLFPKARSCPTSLPRAWYRDAREDNLHDPHLTTPPKFLTPEQVKKLTGVSLIKVENFEDETVQRKIRQEGGFTNVHHLDYNTSNPDYKAKLRKFSSEHLHTGSEGRLVMEGSGYFDIRDNDNKWIRLHVQAGDLVNLPAGTYHRHVLDNQKGIKMLRLFSDPLTLRTDTSKKPRPKRQTSRTQQFNSKPKNKAQ